MRFSQILPIDSNFIVALTTPNPTGFCSNFVSRVISLLEYLRGEHRSLDWDEVIRITRPIYRDMPLTHYNHISYDENKNNLFHWALIRDQVKADVDIARDGWKGD